MTRSLGLLLAFAIVLSARLAGAHKPSDSYLSLEPRGSEVGLRWDIALRDLEHALSLDRDLDGAITWGELRGRHDEVASYALSRLRVTRAGKPCSAQKTNLQVVSHSDGAYASLSTALACEAASPGVELDYRLFFAEDPQHRGVVRVDTAGASETAILTATDSTRRFEASGGESGLLSMVRLGVHHIFEGLDHLLFLFALLLPSVLRREGGSWRPAPDLKAALVDALKIATAFTIAHSVTLSLAALGIFSLPSRLVESFIACSVVVAAFNNLHPLFTRARWAVAFALGLLHGFGFASTLGDLGLRTHDIVRALVGFNLGVELGQCSAIALFVPIAFALRKTEFYRGPALVGGSVGILGLAFLWLLERALALELLV
jgi:hypothetical protein